MELNWEIKNLEWALQTNVVYRVKYSVLITDQDNTASAGGNILLHHPGMLKKYPLRENLKDVIFADYPNQEGFVPLDQLTPEIVIDWVKENLGTKVISEINDLLLRELQLKRNPETEVGLPSDWTN